MTRHGRKTIVAALCAVIFTFTAIPLATMATASPAKPAARATKAADPPICPGTTDNERFVRWIYLNILFRCPDAGGLTYWSQQLDQGLGRWAFARLIDNSDENIILNNVNPFFGDALGRAPSAVETQLAADNIRANEGDARLTADVISSDEFYNGSKITGATPQERDQSWLSFAYNAIVDRNPDPDGAAYFSAILGASGSTQETRHRVAIALEFSAENAGGWIGAVYGAGLHRAPDADGFAYWQNWLLTTGFRTFRMWTGFLSSDEGNAIAQTNPNPPPDEAPQSTHSVKTL